MSLGTEAQGQLPGSANTNYRSHASSTVKKPLGGPLQLRDHLKTPGTPINMQLGITLGGSIIGNKRPVVLPGTVQIDESFSTAPLNNNDKTVYEAPKISILSKPASKHSS